MKVLIAEDDLVCSTALQAVLKMQGFEVTVAENGAEAWQKYQADSYPLVITDWMMPQMDGLELTRCIRAQTNQPYVCVIMLTSRREPEARLQAMSAGVDVFLNKPILAEDMIARLQVARYILDIETNQYSKPARLI